jgi:molybdate transport system substrate-binding protein
VSRKASVVLLIGLLLPACGSSTADTSSKTTKLTVLAAASLQTVLPKIGAEFTDQHPGISIAFSFAGTDQLAAQIRQGAPADLFAGASTKYGDQLAADHLIDPYRVFCTNQLVVITPATNPAGITSLHDLATKTLKLVIGSATVPVGAYTRTVLSNLEAAYGSGYANQVLENVVSNEDSVTSIVTKVQSGEADAGFVYVTDALSAGSDVNTITLPNEAQAVATYPIAVVSASPHVSVGRQFTDFVLGPSAQQLLTEAGFGPAPAST